MAAPNATIVKWPYGHLLSQTSTSAIVYNNGYGTAVVSSLSHGLATGQYIYIYSSLNQYNGFWYVNVIDTNNFYLQEYATAPNVSFINSGNINYFVSVFDHAVNCIHLPIVYKFKNSLWPNNTVNTAVSVSSFAFDSTYTQLTLSASLGTFNALNYVKITGTNNQTLNQTFQILTKVSGSVITINLPYNAAYNFTGASVILYYNNYHLNVNVWAGLNASHPFAVMNQYQKLVTIQVVPDGNNMVAFNLNEYLKQDLNILTNNLQLDSLPVNTDFFDNFYIEHFETYDTSNGSMVTTYQSDTVSDKSNFEGISTNSKLPFQTRSSGAMSDYIMMGNGKFLTSFLAPVLFACNSGLNTCQYQDVSFILPKAMTTNLTALTLYNTYYNGNIQYQTVQQNIPLNGYGLYRVPVNYSSENFSSNVVQLYGMFNASSAHDIQSMTTHPIPLITPGGTFSNAGGSYPIQYTNNYPGTGYMAVFNCVIPAGTYYLSGTVYCPTSGSNSGSVTTVFLDQNKNIITSLSVQIINGTYQGISGGVFTIPKMCSYIGFQFKYTTGGGTFTSQFNYSLYDSTGTNFPFNAPLSLPYTYKIDSKCENQIYMLSWLNQYGGFDYWAFTGRATQSRNVEKVVTKKKNIFTNWPNSWGEFATTVDFETVRHSRNKILIRSQNIDISQIDDVAAIRQSPLVSIVTSNNSVRTVMIDQDSFDIRKDGDKTFNISFALTYTDEHSAQAL